MFGKKAEGAIGTAIAVVISVVLGGLILVGVISLIDNTVAPSMSKTFENQQDVISRDGDSPAAYLKGDINKDGKVDLEDYDYFVKYINKEDGFVCPDVSVGDLNGDGYVNETDCSLLYDVVEKTQKQQVLGDINNDEKIDTRDVTCLERYIVGWEDYQDIDVSVADINKDGIVNNDDLTALKNMIGAVV